MADAKAGWYDDGSGKMRGWDGRVWTDSIQPEAPKVPGLGGMISRAQADAVAGAQARPAPAEMSYLVLKEKFFGTGSGNLTELEKVINKQAALGYRLHMVFERLN